MPGEKIIYLTQLTRPVNTLITMLSVLVAAVIAAPISDYSVVTLACLSAGLIAAAANTVNDYFDLKIDRINKPFRPLAAGRVSKRSALLAGLTEYGLGNLLAFTISLPMLAFASLFSLVTLWYSGHLKRTVLWGNIAVSISAAAAFVYGGMAVKHPQEALIPAVFAFFFHFGREIIKDMEDAHGDRENRATTFPIRFGFRPSIILIWVNFTALMILTIIPYAVGWYGLTYFMIVILGVYPVLGYVLFSVIRNSEPRYLGFLSNLLKADMLIGLLAIYFR